MNAVELAQQMLAAKREVDEAMSELERCSIHAAQSDRTYRLAKATATLATSGTIQEREAHADKAIADERYEAKLAEDLKVSALEAVRSKRQWLSALQSLAAANRAEAELARWEPREVSA